jgi:hypothetical protein
MQMTSDEIQKSFTSEELDLIEKAKYIRREGIKGNYRYVYEEPHNSDIEKGGKPASIGEIREWGGKKFKKQPNGKWVEVSEHGMTKKQLEYIIKTSHTGGDESKFNERDNAIASKLSDKEYDESELNGG